MEPSSEVRKLQKELNAGTTSLVLLALLARAAKPLYGYEIAKGLDVAAEGMLPMTQGSIYPALRSLEERGLLSGDVQPSASGPPRKYYRITAKGRGELDQWLAAWKNTRLFVDSIVEGCDVKRTIPSRRPDAKVPRKAGRGA